MSVVFDFSASLNDVAPASPMPLSVNVKRNEKELIVDGCHLCVFFLLYSPSILSAINVVFDFNKSLNDAAPVSPILLSVDVNRMKKSGLLMDVICVSSFFCIHCSGLVQ